MSFVFKHPNYYKQLKEKYEQEASSNKHGNDNPDPARRVGPEAGTKTQASSIKRQAASVDVEIYNDTDYKATSIKRQALKEIPDN